MIFDSQTLVKILTYSIPCQSQPNYNSFINSYNSNSLSLDSSLQSDSIFPFKNQHWILQIDKTNVLYRYLLKYSLVCKEWNLNILSELPIDRITITSVNSCRLFISLMNVIRFRQTFHLSIVISQQLNGQLVHNNKEYLEKTIENNLMADANDLFQPFSKQQLVNIYHSQSMNNVFSYDFIPFLDIIKVESNAGSQNYSDKDNSQQNNQQQGNVGFFGKLLRTGSQVLKKELLESLVKSCAKSLRSLKFYHDNWENYYIGYLNELISKNSLNSLDLAGNGLNDSQVKQILESLKSINTLYELNLSRNQISGECLSHFEPIFKANMFLSNVNFQQNKINSNAVKPFLESFKSNVFKKSILFGWNDLDDLAGIMITRFLLTNDTVTNINLASNELTYETFILLNDVLKQTKTLKKLNISCNPLDSEEAIAILSSLKVNQSLKSLSMVGCGIDGSASNSLYEMLQVNTTLTNLDLRHNITIPSESGCKFMSALTTNQTIVKLNMGYCNLGGEVGQALGECLMHNQTLQVLIFNNNQLGEQGMIGISTGLMANNTLKYIDLGSNFHDFECIGYEAGLALAETLKYNTCLESLHLYNNKMGHETVALITAALGEGGNQTLKALNLSSNSIRTEGALAIASLILGNYSLNYLNINNSFIQAEGLMSIIESLKLNTTIQQIGISGNASSLLQLDTITKQLLSENNYIHQMDYTSRITFRRYHQYEKQRSLYKSRKYLIRLFDDGSAMLPESKDKILDLLKPIIYK
ncbi:hypothetical protein DLAC_04157 [Tieghemostelium lacteum]|uniref:Leucine-rich repeat-containing protein (LRR) n=1 Tax=Tieghemostelium lacteum TaxID=361077 RepID=A0A151ZS49_TIELA|nr:hypothetical protein DLAC_04157 [Tieghemostelium lacteum]|eukprot:KYQ96851.1 hypothetical protein DLAC_04157 [Tieghemostelium lacteum]